MPDDAGVDEILGGRLRLRQISTGHRVGLDAVLLSASAGAPARRIVDVGAGVGAIGLALLTRWPGARADLLEIDPTLAVLARKNARLNKVSDRVRIIEADALDATQLRASGLNGGEADLVVTNPPFFEAGAVRASPDPTRARAHVLARSASVGDALQAWVVAALALLAPGGRFQMIHRPDALPAILAAFGRRLGAVNARLVHPRADADAIRILVGGTKGSKAPLRVLPSLILHEPSGAFTTLAEALHRGEAFL